MTQGKASPNDGQLFDVRALGIAVDNTGSFDILGGADGYAIAILQAPSTTGTNAYSTLYRVDLSGLSAPLALANTTQASSDIGNTATGAAARARVIINAAAVRFTP